MRTNQLIIALFQRCCWLDEGLQARLHDHGWPDVNRPQSMVMTNIVSGIVRPSDIARNLGVSRQAIHSTINPMVKLGIVRLDVDPDDRRHMRSEDHPSELQSLMRISYAVFCLKKKINNIQATKQHS